MKRLLFAGIAALSLTACTNATSNQSETSAETPATETPAAKVEPEAAPEPGPVVSHDIWEELLQKHVSEAGNVSYKGLQADEARFQEYLNLLRNNHPAEGWSEDEIKVYWINAYNAFTVELILKNYPLESITSIKEGDKDAWNIPFITIGEKTYTLNDIEKGILLTNYDEPRIHFAVVCASFSCPKLLNHAFTVDQLEDQLVAQTKGFLADTKRNVIAADKMEVSQIFEWYVADFTKHGTLIEFLNTYAPVTIQADASVGYLAYDWSLNE